MRASAMDVGELARMAADNRSCVICTPAIHGGRAPTALPAALVLHPARI
jgi:hypothetical protein